MDFLNGVKIGKPVVRELRISSLPESVFDRIHSMPFSFFLDSGMDRYKLGRYSFMGYAPFLILKSKGNRIEITIGRDKYTMIGNPFNILDSIIRHYRIQSDLTSPPFIGGGVGYFAYDLCHFVERLPKTVVDDLGLPDCYFCFYDRVLTYEHEENRWYLSVTDFDGTKDSRSIKTTEDHVRESEEEILTLLNNPGIQQLDLI
ncbi:MAG: hypothetical protein COZ68_04150, partial [Deltaproteobacteria bacterium CG_4_8_14_3_um_filter_43_13]